MVALPLYRGWTRVRDTERRHGCHRSAIGTAHSTCNRAVQVGFLQAGRLAPRRLACNLSTVRQARCGECQCRLHCLARAPSRAALLGAASTVSRHLYPTIGPFRSYSNLPAFFQNFLRNLLKTTAAAELRVRAALWRLDAPRSRISLGIYPPRPSH